MKRLVLVLVLIGTTTLFFSCNKDEPALTSPEFEQTAQEKESLSKMSVKRFSGDEKFVAMHNPGTWTPLPNGMSLGQGGVYEYYDNASDPRVTGKVMFTVNGVFDNTFSGKFWGSGELTTDIGGSWELKIVGKRIAAEGSFADAIGYGKGKFEGLVAHWKYERLEPEKDDFTFKGFIIEQ